MYQILITDDEEQDRKLLKILLEKHYPERFDFLEAQHGLNALEILEREPVQLMMLDISMPEMDGIELLRRIPADKRPYIILLTAHDKFEYAREALRHGVKEYLLKPPQRSELYAAVDRFLEAVPEPAGQIGTEPNHMVQSVLEQMQADCSRSWSIGQLADELHVNASYLSHQFKESTGCCFTDYLADLRVERAIELMRENRLNLAQIGEAVGYEDPNYFSRVFKKRKGMSPRKYMEG